jgi:hypothetical protein
MPPIFTRTKKTEAEHCMTDKASTVWQKCKMIRLSYSVLGMMLMAAGISCPAAEARVGTDSSGRPVLLVDNSPSPLVAGLCGTEKDNELKPFRQAGLKLEFVFANLGLYPAKLGYVSPLKYMHEFWCGPGDYNPSEIDKILSRPLKVNPDCKIILWLGIGVYPEFGFNYPDDVIRNEKGEALIATTHFIRFDSKPPVVSAGNAEHYAISFFSKRYQDECSAMLTAFVKAVEKSPYADNVIGYRLGGGQDGQLYSWSPPNSLLKDPDNWGDYSVTARKAFPGWLKRKYNSDLSALNRAWRVNLSSFAEASPPPAAKLAPKRPFLDSVTEQNVYDWKRFLAEGRADLLDGFAASIKKASGKNVLVVATGGDGGHRRDNTSIYKLLRSKHIDILLHQATYGVRIPPAAGGINALLDSYAINGKLFLTDMDHRLWTRGGRSSGVAGGKGSVLSWTADSVGQARDMAMQRDMWRREYARLWVSGNNGAWFNNGMGPGEEYDNPEIITEMRFLNDTSAAIVKQRCLPSRGQTNKSVAADVAFIFDEEMIDYAGSALAEFHAAGMYRQWSEANASGVPIRYYYAQDLRDGLVPDAKLYVLQNFINIDDTLAQRIKALRKSGATIVVLQGTGMAQLAHGQSAFLDNMLGISLRPIGSLQKDVTKQSVRNVYSSHALLAGDAWNAPKATFDTEKLKEVDGIALTVADQSSSVLARYPASGLPAIAAVEKNGSKVVFVGAYTLSRDLVSRLAAYANAWRVAPVNNVVAANGEILMIQSLYSGDIELVLKELAGLTELPPGNLTSAPALRHKFKLESGHTYLFSLGKKDFTKPNFNSETL